MGTEAPKGSEKSQLEVSPAKSRVKLNPSPRPSRSTSVLIVGKLRSVLLLFEVVVLVEEAPVRSSELEEGVVLEGAGE